MQFGTKPDRHRNGRKTVLTYRGGRRASGCHEQHRGKTRLKNHRFAARSAADLAECLRVDGENAVCFETIVSQRFSLPFPVSLLDRDTAKQHNQSR